MNINSTYGRMEPGLSFFLDALRIAAALVVFIAHAPGPSFIEDVLGRWQIAHDAVMVFFVLSGYVIAYATLEKDKTLSNYAINRASRIYSVALPAIALTVAVEIFGRSFYPQAGFPHPITNLMQWIPLSVLFLNQIWTVHGDLPTQLPFWSLAYEVPYYVIFAAAVFSPRNIKLPLTVALCIAAGPQIVLLLPVWLIGVGVFLLHRRGMPSPVIAYICFPISIIGLCIAKYLGGYGPANVYFFGNWLGDILWNAFHINLNYSIRFMWDWTIGIFVGLMLWSAPPIFRHLDTETNVCRAISWLAGFTFSIYLYQAPLIVLTRYYMHHNDVSPIILYPVYWMGMILLMVAIGTITESQKKRLRDFLRNPFPTAKRTA